MVGQTRSSRSEPKRPALWDFRSLGTLRQLLFHRAGKLTRPEGYWRLTVNGNTHFQTDLTRYLEALTKTS